MKYNFQRKNDIDALMLNMQSKYEDIKKLYDSSLYKQEIDFQLKIEVKNYLENARSILDYCVHDIKADLAISNDVVYFPVMS